MTTVQPPKRSRRSLVTSIMLAVALLVAVVVFYGPLVSWFTGKSMGGAGASVTVQAGSFSVKAALDPDPPTTKGNALVIEIHDGSGKPVDDAKIDVAYDMPAMAGMPEMKGNASVKPEDGHYRAEFDLPMDGTWPLSVGIQAPSGSASLTLKLTVGSKGLSSAGSAGGAMPSMSGKAADGMIAPFEYPSPALDPLRGAMDAVDRARAHLARDEMKGVSNDARTIAEALRAIPSALPKDRVELANCSSRAASDADRLSAAKSLEDARKVFADLNRDLLPLLGADARLTDGWHVFECPMFDHARWTQRGDAPENPYLGTKMPTCGTASTWQLPAASAAPASGAPGEIDHYTCSMHPSVKQKAPGTCPICGMDLIPVTKEQQEQGVVMIDEARRQLIGVRTAPVIEGPMRDTFRAVGRVTYDESALADVNLKVRGWITQLLVNQTGQRVERGQTLFTMYSPELYNAQQDFLLATQGTTALAMSSSDAAPPRSESFARAARQRLRLLGMGDAQIDAVAKRGAPMESIPVPSPASGFVIEKNVVEGAAVDAGMRLYRIAALNKVWVEAEVYEADLARVRTGQPVKVTLDYLRERAYDAKVAYVYPYLDSKARTGRVRVEIANKELDLRPGMYASVELGADLGNLVQVPAAAVVYTGPRRLVFIDLGQGRFKPQEIQVGTEANGMFAVLSGLRPGDLVATSGVFLIAAEARISTAAKYWESSPESDDGGTTPSGAAGASSPSASSMPPMPSMPTMPSMPMPKMGGKP